MKVCPLCKRVYDNEKEKIYKTYLEHTKYINNWDLVDLSAHYIVGRYLIDKPKDILFELAVSDHLWEKRISILASFWFIKNDEFREILR